MSSFVTVNEAFQLDQAPTAHIRRRLLASIFFFLLNATAGLYQYDYSKVD